MSSTGFNRRGHDRHLRLTWGDVSTRASVNDSATVGTPVAIAAGATVQCGARLLRGTAAGENARISSNAVLINTVVCPDAHIGPGAVLQDCIVGAETTVDPNVTAEGGHADVRIDATVHEDVTLGALFGDGTTVGGNTTVDPGTIIGNDVDIESGCSLTGGIPSGGTLHRG